MVHQGGLANYQISRCLTYVDEQSISFFDNFQEIHTGKKNRQRLLYVHVGMRYDLSGNGIRCEFFFLPAGNIVYRLIFTITLSFITYLVQDFMLHG